MIHHHPLYKFEAKRTYKQHKGKWFCDRCNKKPNKTTSWHCPECSFDLCEHCHEGYTPSVLFDTFSTLHDHPMFCFDERRIRKKKKKCDHCGLKGQVEDMFACLGCWFFLCRDCFLMTQVIMDNMRVEGREHPLMPRNSKEIFDGKWQCNECNERDHTRAYGCEICCYWICYDCFTEKNIIYDRRTTSVHVHPLQQRLSTVVYRRFNGDWRCDNCNEHFNSNHILNHCDLCEFDLCEDCYNQYHVLNDQQLGLKKQLKKIELDLVGLVCTLHEHALFIRDPLIVYQRFNGTWHCDNCKRVDKPKMHHCDYCRFDLCEECVQDNLVHHAKEEKVENRFLCRLCSEKSADTMNAPCGCLFLCWECSANFRGENGDICNSCREPSEIYKIKRNRDCDLCFETVTANESIATGQCGHLLCFTCATMQVRYALGDVAASFPLLCPLINNGRRCETVVQKKVITKIFDGKEFLEEGVPPLDEEEVEKYDYHMMLSSIPPHQRCFCPYDDCGKVFIIEGNNDDEKKKECPYCKRHLCFVCKVPWHDGLNCAQYALLDREPLNDRASKPCPNCGTFITHYYGNGCHHIRPGSGCPGCGVHFCYSCLMYPFEYGHRKADGSPCPTWCDNTCGCPICSECRGAGCRLCR